MRIQRCLAGVVCFAVALSALAQEATLSLRLPAEDKVAFRGIPNFDGVGPATPAPVYPAPNLAGALAALLTHAVIVDSVGRNKQDQLRESADRVLAPHREVLDKLSYRELLQGASARMTVPGEKQIVNAGAQPASGLVIDSAPVFSMTQDAQSIVLDNPVAVRRPGEVDGKAYVVVVRVVSAPQEAPPWSNDGGKLLKERSAALLAESFDAALGAMARQTSTDAPQRTVRYRQGKEERMERAQVLAEQCDRLLIRNLRGWLMSVPVVCEETAAPVANRP